MSRSPRPDAVALEAAAQLRAVLAAIERGELAAGSARARALARRIEGAAVALEAIGRDAIERSPSSESDTK